MRTLDFWFDYSCPYAYVASERVEALAARTGARLRWRPMLLGGVFAARQTPQNLTTTLPPAKARWQLQDQHRLAQLAGAPFSPPAAHPRRTVAALRATLARGNDPALIHAFYRAYWAEHRAIEDLDVVRAIAGDLDLEGQRDRLRAETDEAIRRGIFGAPTYVVWDGPADDPATPTGLWWGGDREPLVEAALLQGVHPVSVAGTPLDAPSPAAARFVDRPAVPPVDRLTAPSHDAPALGDAATPTLDVYVDFSSPYAYLGAMRAADLAERTGARLTWKPFLLGAVFKAIGQANVPLLAMNEAKQAWYQRDMFEYARHLGLPFRFNPHFPLRTVLTARLALAHPDPGAFLHRVFDAAWARDQDVTALPVLRALGAGAGLPPGVPDTDEHLLALAETQKGALFAHTTEAIELGAFGAPTFVVRTSAGGPWVFWGQDRMDQVEAALTGWVPTV